MKDIPGKGPTMQPYAIGSNAAKKERKEAGLSCKQYTQLVTAHYKSMRAASRIRSS
jgi:hypothetical protein